MRVALISISSGSSPDLAGRSVAQRQLDFALALGCERIICIGNGALPEAIALRHDAEDGGAKYQVSRDAHGLLGATGTADAVFVFAEGLLLESDKAFDMLDQGSCILVLPAGPGVDAGFERLDLAHAWAGAMRLPGRLVERLAELPADADPMPGLLRIARQGGLTEKSLGEEALTTGEWLMLRTGKDSEVVEPTWLSRHLPSAPRYSPTKNGFRWVATRFPRRLAPIKPLYAGATAALLAVGAAVAAWFGHPTVGLASLAVASLAGELSSVLAKVRRAGFRRPGGRIDWTNLVRLLVDLSFVATGFLVLDGTWLERLFPPVILIGLLLLRPRELTLNWGALIADRAIIGAILAMAATFEVAKPAFMAFSVAVLACLLLSPNRKRG